MSNHDKDAVLNAAHNQWRRICLEFGFPPESLASGVPCPKCGGIDRFDFSDINGNGSLICRHCACKSNGTHVSNGIGAIAWWKDWSFSEACNQIGDHLGLQQKTQGSDGESRKWPKISRVDPRHEIYETFLKALGLSEEHRDHLRTERKLSDESIDRNGYATLSESRALKGLEALCVLSSKGNRGEQILATPGFQVIKDELRCICGDEGILIPLRDATGRISMLQLRKDDPKAESRYVGFAYKGQLVGNLKPHHTSGVEPGATIRITEGPLKADIAYAHSGIPAIAIPGVASAKLAMEAITASTPGRVLIALDADFATNKDVTRAITKLAEFCKAQDIPYAIETWPAETKGIDDFLIAGSGLIDEMDLAKFRELAGHGNEIRHAFNDGRVLAERNLATYRTATDGGELRWHRDQWWKYKSGRYKMVSDRELRSKIQPVIQAAYDEEFERLQEEEYDSKRISRRPTREDTNCAITALESMCFLSDSTAMPSWLPDARNRQAKPKRFISMTNGLLDIEKVFRGADVDELVIPHTPDWFSSFMLEYEFDPFARCPLWDKYLQVSLEGDQERVHVLQEWAGYLLTATNSHQRFLALEGEGANGKTVYFAGLTAMLGAANISNVPLDKFSNSFALSSTIGKVANICGDVGQIDAVAEGELKNFTGGGTVYFDRKNKSAVESIPTAKVMLSWNNRPRIVDKSDGIWRRMILVPFNSKIPVEERVEGMDLPSYWLEQGEAAGILMWAIQGLMRLSSQGFTKSTVSQTATEEYQAESNPIRDFAIERLKIDRESSVSKADVYADYKKWCSENGYRPLAARSFGKNLRRIGLEINDVKIGPKSSRRNAYRGIELRDELDF